MALSKSEINGQQLDSFARSTTLVATLNSPAAGDYYLMLKAPFDYTIRGISVAETDTSTAGAAQVSIKNGTNTVVFNSTAPAPIVPSSASILHYATVDSEASNHEVSAGESIFLTIADPGTLANVEAIHVQLYLERTGNPDPALITGGSPVSGDNYPNDVEKWWADL